MKSFTRTNFLVKMGEKQRRLMPGQASAAIMNTIMMTAGPQFLHRQGAKHQAQRQRLCRLACLHLCQSQCSHCNPRHQLKMVRIGACCLHCCWHSYDEVMQRLATS